jgi:hypothetical protein
MNAPRSPKSTALRTPIPDADEEGRIVWTALLERRCIMLGHENIRLRACLERATGQPWDSVELADPTPAQLDELVAGEMARGLRIPMAEARKRVEFHKQMANPSQSEISQVPDELRSPER